MNQFILGFSQIFPALKTVRTNRRLFLVSLLPAGLMVGLFLLGLSLSWSYFLGWQAYLVGALGGFFGFFFVVVAWVVFAVALTYLVYALGIVLASPLFGLLAQQALALMGHESPSRKWSENLSLSLKMFTASAMKAALFLVLGLVLFVASFFPLMAPICSFAAVLIMAFDCSDYAFEMLEMNLRERLSFFFRHILAYSGLACLLGLVILVPGLFFLFLPALVVAASQLTWKLRYQRFKN